MKRNQPLQFSYEKIKKDLRNFINLSLHEDERSWSDWISSVVRRVSTRCWERKQCGQVECPAYQNICGRCWIIAGTLCGSEPQGRFAKKYQSCKECEIYQEVVYQDPVIEIEEHLVILVHSLRSKQQELHEVATVDSLTRLHNRRYFDSYLEHEREKLKRKKSGLVVMMIDINGFKRINDTFGHAAGDQVLKECANILAACVRKSDVVARYGGDEFTVALHEYGERKDYAQVLIARIEEHVSAWNRCDENRDTPISLSFGYAPLHKDDDLLEVMAKADQAMYLDKKRKKAAAG